MKHPVSLSSPIRLLGLLALLLGATMARAQDQPANSYPGDVMLRIGEIQELQSRQRYTDALQKLDELQNAHPEVVDIYNMRGSILLTGGLRDFDKAREQFEKARQLRPNSLAVLFNLAELEFVAHHFAVAEQQFAALVAEDRKVPMPVRHLIEFKRVVCLVKLGKLDEAQAMLKRVFTFMDDTPAYYYANAALEFQKEAKSKAQEWMVRAEAIFDKNEVTPYVDALIEARWLPHIGLPPVDGEKPDSADKPAPPAK